MRLLTIPSATSESIEVGMLGINGVQKMAGRTSYGNVVIQVTQNDDDNEVWRRLKGEPHFVLGEKIERIAIDKFRLFGVVPIDQQHDLFECRIDHFVMEE